MRNLNHLLPLIAVVFILSSCEKEEPEMALESPNSVVLKLNKDIEPLNDREALSRNELEEIAKSKFAREGVFQWSEVSDYVVWSAAIASDSIISVGYQPEGYSNIDQSIHEINVNQSEWRNVREALISYVLDTYQRLYPDQIWERSDVVAFGDKPLPYINLRVWDYEVLANLRNFSVVRYCEPMGFGMEGEIEASDRSDSGCGGNSAAPFVPANDFYTSPQGAMVSWNYIPMKIHQAWQQSKGENIKIGLIDTGMAPDQQKMGSGFATGFSSNRTIEKIGTHQTCTFFIFCSDDGPDDQCGHGTNMGGTIAAPFSSDGSPSGVAWKSSLVSVRASQDVLVNSSTEKDGVSDAFYELGSRADLKIISMSMGDLFSSGQVTDAVNYAYNQGKMILAAAGTSFEFTTFVGVIFPANLSSTLAITGIKTGSLNNMQKCSNCHSGSLVDFVVTMQDRNNASRTPLTLADVGNAPTYTGGSSVATATAAGIAALVWATDPSQSRANVMDRMKEASNFYPNRNGQFGWGLIDANAAVLN